MILNRISDKNNSKLIAEKYVNIVDSGVDSSQILVLTLNADSKKNVIKNILNLTKNNIISDLKVYTFNGLIYNTILDNWSYLEKNIKDDKSVILPNLTGLELSQFLLKQIIRDNDVKGYNSKKSLLHQIFRRYSLIVNNNLSDDEVREKSEILGEAFADDARAIIQKFKTETISFRCFDYIRQAQIFTHIYKKTDYFKNIKYLLLEDGDECSPLILDFIKTLAPDLKDYLIIFDKDGGSRCGYLCAEMNISSELENIFRENIPDNPQDNVSINSLRANILNDEKNTIKNFNLINMSKRLEMVDEVVLSINKLISDGTPPNQIAVISPIQDKMLKYTLKEGLRGCVPVFLSGNEKLSDNSMIKAILVILKLSLKMAVDEYELRIILSKCSGIPIKNCKNIIQTYTESLSVSPCEAGIYTDKYKNFCSMIDKLKNSKAPLSEKAYFVYTNFVQEVTKADLTKFNFFLKELQDFERVLKSETDYDERNIIIQIENSIISENPYSSFDINKDELVIGTPQKIIDKKIRTKYQFWLDISSSEWIKPDIGPLYNAWVFQKNWDKDTYTVEDNIRLSKEKTARVLRKLVLLSDKVNAYSSLFDTQGAENLGGIDKYIIPEKKSNTKEAKNRFKIIPRADQKPVLDYKSGKMAISAVPGAGKTTILLALIIKLLQSGVNPENMYVMTYMESAARNFKDRIKKINPDNNKLPNISTIHGLALRILKENSNFERIGLNPDFEICDDTQRGRIIKSISGTIDKQDIEDFDRAISVLKLSGADINIQTNKELNQYLKMKQGSYDDMKLSRFLNFFYKYQYLLEEQGLIDYDDILISSVRLLEENKDILKHYQEVCEYIIEDEAQDSSYIQQKLVNLLGEKHGNIIRCGDINQAITTTFTNADVDGFKKFIETSQRVDMNCSQRCSEGVWKLANALVNYGNSISDEPFYKIYMNPVEGQNPIEKNPVYSNIYKNTAEEKIAVVNTIKTILKTKPDASIGILLRNNYQVNTWAEYINNSGLTAITRNECLGQKSIFKVIFSILKLISNPFDNTIAAYTYRSMSECGIFRLYLDKIIENYDTDFISLDNDEIENSDLARFHWDMNYWLSFPDLTIDELVLKIGLTYFSEDIAKSNIYLISTLTAKLNIGSFAQTVQRLEELSSRPALSGFKFFSEDEEQDKTNGKIQIMTLHKSKGDEFDYVFLPELTEKNLTLDVQNIKLKKSANFTENVRSLNKEYVKKSESELKQFLISENFRLLYVAITRAKQRLYISAPEIEKYFGKETKTNPCVIFDELLSAAV